VGRTSPQTLYLPSLASFDMAGYTPEHAEGFIRLFGLPLATAAHRGNGHKKGEPVSEPAGGASR
jgi:argininosuccinate synthase